MRTHFANMTRGFSDKAILFPLLAALVRNGWPPVGQATRKGA
jgi:hypothetical protein